MTAPYEAHMTAGDLRPCAADGARREQHSPRVETLAADVRRLQERLHARAFCYESPSDFRAGVDALVALLTSA